MGLWSWITGKNAFPAVEKTDDSIERWFREFGERQTSSGITVNANTAMSVIAVMACVRVRALDMAKLPPKIYRIAKNGARTEARDHPLWQLFRRPNSWQSWLEFSEFMQMGLLLWGNAYAVVLRNPRGVPIAMIPLNPARVSLWEAPGGDVFYQVARQTLHEIAVLADYPTKISSDDMFHLRWASGGDSLMGISPIAQAAEGIGLAKGQERLAANLMGSGARPSGILTTDKRLSEPVIKRFKAQWDALHSGVERSGRTAVLEEGLKFQPLTLNSVDLEFMAARNFQLGEICRIFGVSPVKIGVIDRGTAPAFEQIQLSHYADTVHPDLVRWEQKLTQYFDLPPELIVSFDETELLRADLAARTNAARSLQSTGITTPNESRAAFGLDPDPDGDELLVPANMLPLSTLIHPPVAAPIAGQSVVPKPGLGSDQTGAPAEGGDGDPAAIPPLQG